MNSRSLIAVVGFCVSSIVCQDANAQDWAVWRGYSQNGTGATTDSRFEKTKHLKLNWQRMFGAGYSRVSAIGDKLLATFADKKQ